MVTAMTGVMPRPGDLVHITEHAAVEFTHAPIRHFRAIEAELMPARPGWCRLYGWDADEQLRNYRWCTALIAALTFQPGDEWSR